MIAKGTLRTMFGEYEVEKEFTTEEKQGLALDVAMDVLRDLDEYQNKTYFDEHCENLAAYLLTLDAFNRTYDIDEGINLKFNRKELKEALLKFKNSSYHAYLKKQEKIERLMENIDRDSVMEMCLEDPEFYKKFKKFAKNF